MKPLELTYRNAYQEDLESLVSLLANDKLGSMREDNSLPLNPRYQSVFEAISKDPNISLIVVEANKRLVAMLQLSFIPCLTHTGSWRGLIERVRVHEKFRGLGIGRCMFDYAIAKAKEKGCSIVQLTSDKRRPEALRFYEKLGFKASHEGFKLTLQPD